MDARDVDFSDRVNGKRKSYRATSRRQRILEDGTEELEDASDEDDGESLQRKIARLKREIEEAKEEQGRLQAAGAEDSTIAKPDVELELLSKTLDEISRLPDPAARGTAPKLVTTAVPGATGISQMGEPSTNTATTPAGDEPLPSLARAADFDRRLQALEKVIGISSSALPELDSTGLRRAIMPTVEALHKQISMLSEASTSSLDSISRRVRTLIQEAEELEKTRKSAKAAQEALSQAGGAPPAESTGADDSEQTAKINALYGTLPTIENLAPLLPLLLGRLRSLRAIHADAAAASETLDQTEKKQAEMAADIKQWREGLDKMEAAMEEGESAMAGNMKIIESWVKELEGKTAKLALG